MKELTFNLNYGTLLGYKVGEAIPTEFQNESYIEKKKGFAINIFDSSISSIIVCFRNGYEGFQEFEGAVEVEGKKYILNKDTSLDEIKTILGEPTDEWNDGVEKCAEFERGGMNIEVIWHVDGPNTLDYISIESD